MKSDTSRVTSGSPSDGDDDGRRTGGNRSLSADGGGWSSEEGQNVVGVPYWTPPFGTTQHTARPLSYLRSCLGTAPKRRLVKFWKIGRGWWMRQACNNLDVAEALVVNLYGVALAPFPGRTLEMGHNRTWETQPTYQAEPTFNCSIDFPTKPDVHRFYLFSCVVSYFDNFYLPRSPFPIGARSETG
jgi:hypothetical protein